MREPSKIPPLFRGYRYRVYPQAEVEKQIIKTIEAFAKVYNLALEEKERTFDPGKKDSDFRALASYAISKAKEIPGINPQIGFYAAIRAHSAFRAAKAENPSNTPLPKKVDGGFGSFTLGLTNPKIKKIGKKKASVFISGVGHVEFVYHRDIPKDVRYRSVTISRNRALQCYISFDCECPQREGKHEVKKAIGLDFSVPSLYVSSDKEIKPDPEQIHQKEKYELKLAQENSKLAKLHKGSCKYKKQLKKLVKLYVHVKNKRMDFIHKETTRLADNYDFIGVETVSLKSMCDQYKFYKRVYDDSWTIFLHALKYKMESRRKILMAVPPYYPSSKTCHRCGTIKRDLTLADRIFECPNCHNSVDRDLNAARNIRDQALRNAGFRIRYVPPTQAS